MRVLYYVLKVLLFLPAKIFFPVKVIGKENLPKGRFVMVSNHLTGFDVILMWRYIPRFKRFMTKKELRKNPFVRFILWSLGAIFMDRHKMDMKGMKKCISEAKKHSFSVFPEGTRNRETEQLQQIKGGAVMIAVKAESPVVAVMMHHRTRIFRKNYIYISPYFNLPYNSKDRFNSASMNECIEIMTNEMNDAKDFLDKIISLRDKNEIKRLNLEFKAKKKEYNKHIADTLKN